MPSETKTNFRQRGYPNPWMLVVESVGTSLLSAEMFVAVCVTTQSNSKLFVLTEKERERGQQTPTNSNCFRSIAVLPLCAIMCLMSSHLIYRCPPTYTGCFVLSTLNVCNYYSSLLFLSKGSNCTTLKSVLPAIYIHCKTDPLIRMSK